MQVGGTIGKRRCDGRMTVYCRIGRSREGVDTTRGRARSRPASRLTCGAADAESALRRSDTNGNRPRVEASRCGPSLARRRRPRGPNAHACVAGLQHNVALCKPPACHGACGKAPASRADAGQAPRQPVASHNTRSCWRPAGAVAPGAPRPGSRVASPRGHPWPRRFGHGVALRVDRLPTLRRVHRHALRARAAHAHTAACARRAHACTWRCAGRVGLTAARFKPNPLRCGGGSGIQGNSQSRGDLRGVFAGVVAG